ncbi:ABC transporter permease [Heyndrickxia coagulans]|nr:ABC transporter permease [Heyndrickxia coagulans]
MKSAITVIKEQINSFYLILRLSAYEMRSQNKSNYLGVLWEIINPMIQISIYWFVFGFGIRGGHPRPQFIPWLLAGISVWFFIYPSVMQGSRSVYSRIKMVAKMNFPLSAIPSYVILSKIYQHFMLLAIIIVILNLKGYTISIYYFGIAYYFISVYIFVFGLSLVTSTLSTIVRDVQNIVQALMRMMIYLTPILWNPNTLSPKIQAVLKLNPFYYVIEGYRSSLLGNEGWYFINHWHYTLYFWVMTIVIFIIGSSLHVKFRNRFVDFL